MSKRWDEFIYWCSRYYEDQEAFDRQERKHTLRVAAQAIAARDSVFSGSDDWMSLVRKPLSSHLCHHYPKMEFDRWLASDPHGLQSALMLLWRFDITPGDRIDRFLEVSPIDLQRNQFAEPAVVLHTAMGVEHFPTYRATRIQRAFLMTGFPDFKESGIELRGERYEHVLEFFDRVIKEASDRGIQLRDRLDSQGLTWGVTYWQPPEHWDEGDRKRILEFRGDQAAGA